MASLHHTLGPITERELSDLIEEANSIIVAHNLHHPSYPLRTLSEAAVTKTSRKDVEKRIGKDLANCSAIYHREADHIYFIQDALPKDIQDAMKQQEFFAIKSPQVVRHAVLLSILLHENIHRSCVDQPQSVEVTQTYLDIVRNFFEGSEHDDTLASLTAQTNQLMASGLNIAFVYGDASFQFPDNAMDEYVVQWYTGKLIGPYLAETGDCARPSDGFLFAMLSRLRKPVDVYIGLIDTFMEHPDPETFMKEYFKGDIPHRVVQISDDPVYIDGYNHAAYVLFGQMTGRLEGLEHMVKLYGPAGKEEERAA
jgi:hypothetical protein